MVIDITANASLESGLGNATIAAIFAGHNRFDVHIDDDVAMFSDGGRLFFATPYQNFYRSGDYVRIENPITINLCIDEEVHNFGTLQPGTEVTRSWKYDAV